MQPQDGSFAIAANAGICVRAERAKPLRWQLAKCDVESLLELSPRGDQMVVMVKGRGVELRDPKSLAKTRDLGHPVGDRLASYSPSGTHVALARDGNVTLHDTLDWREVARLEGRQHVAPAADDGTESAPDPDEVLEFSFNKLGGHLLVHQRNAGIRVVNVTTGKLVLKTIAVNMRPLSITSDRTLGVACHEDLPILLVVDLETARKRTMDGRCIGSGPAALEGEWLAVAGVGDETEYVNVRTGAHKKELEALEIAAPPWALRSSSTQPELALAVALATPESSQISYDFAQGGRIFRSDSVAALDLQTGREVSPAPKCAEPLACHKVKAEGNKLELCLQAEPACAELDLGFAITNVYRSDSRAWVVARGEKAIAVIDVEGKKEVARMASHPSLPSFAWRAAAPGTREAELVIHGGDELSSIDLATGARRQLFSLGGRPAHLTRLGVLVEPDRKHFALLDWSGRVMVQRESGGSIQAWSVAEDEPILIVMAGSETVAVRVPSGEVVARAEVQFAKLAGRYLLATEGGRLRLLDMTNNAQATTLFYVKPHDGWVGRGLGGFGEGETGFDARVVATGQASLPALACRFGATFTPFDACSGRFAVDSLADEP